MTILTRSERLALLVNLLGEDSAGLARSGLSGQRLEEFESALEQFASVVDIPPSGLQSAWEDLNDAFEDAEARAKAEHRRAVATGSLPSPEWRDWPSM